MQGRTYMYAPNVRQRKYTIIEFPFQIGSWVPWTSAMSGGN